MTKKVYTTKTNTLVAHFQICMFKTPLGKKKCHPNAKSYFDHSFPDWKQTHTLCINQTVRWWQNLLWQRIQQSFGVKSFIWGFLQFSAGAADLAEYIWRIFGALSSVQNVQRIAVRKMLETRAQGFLVLVEFRLQQKALAWRPMGLMGTFCILGGSSCDLLLLVTPTWSVCPGNFL